jgi:hypothetical protein
LAPYISKYIFPDEQYALVIAFWTVFILIVSALWALKQVFFLKIYSKTKEKTISFFPPVDKIGGAICGILLALNLTSCVIVSLYIAPVTKNLYNLRQEDKIIFRADEAYLKTYNKFISFDWREFMDGLKPEEPAAEEEKQQKELPKVEKIILSID